MRTNWPVCALALLFGAVAGCGDDEPSGPAPEEITGTWNATKAEYVMSEPPNTAVDLVALGGSVTLTLGEGGDFEFVVTPPAEASFTTNGTWTLGGETLSLTPEGMPFSWQFDVALSGDSLGLSGASVEYDFDDDGTPEQATLNLLFVRAGS